MIKTIKFILSWVSTWLAIAVVICLATDRQTWGWILAYWIVVVVNNVLSLVGAGSML